MEDNRVDVIHWPESTRSNEITGLYPSFFYNVAIVEVRQQYAGNKTREILSTHT